jgi:hypothetical protein
VLLGIQQAAKLVAFPLLNRLQLAVRSFVKPERRTVVCRPASAFLREW